MPGGLLNIVSYGAQNIILNGNPNKTMFKTTYAKYTNFGLQKFRIDYEGIRYLRLNDMTTMNFKMPRHADLLMDTFVVVSLPHIWSPVIPPNTTEPYNAALRPNDFSAWRTYDFKWIKNIGTHLIKEVRFNVGGQIIQKFSGNYLLNLIERDFDEGKKKLYYEMTGNVPELNDPANANQRINVYPNVYYDGTDTGPEPSIRGRKIYIPLNIWFTMAAKMAFPLISLQYTTLYIEIDFRPINELYVVRNVRSCGNYISANQTDELFQFHRFLHPPPNVDLNYTDPDPDTDTYKKTEWAADVHLISTYAFLSTDEQTLFASAPQEYLIKEIYEYSFQNIHGPSKISLDSIGMVSNWQWFFQRSDIGLRNEWSNYTNWEYEYIPNNVISTANFISTTNFEYLGVDIPGTTKTYTPDINPRGGADDDIDQPTGIFITGPYKPQNQKYIMNTWGLLLDGTYRENTQDSGVLNYIEKYTRTKGNSGNGVYCYNFCINTNPFDFQPNGALNTSMFKDIEFELTTHQPPMTETPSISTICNELGEIIGVSKPAWNMYQYTYDLTVLEERYNILSFISGNAALKFAR